MRACLCLVLLAGAAAADGADAQKRFKEAYRDGATAAARKEAILELARADLPEAAADFQLDRAAIFAGVDRKPEDPANLFRIAIALENRASAYFADCATRAADGSVEQQLYRELAAEEREHAQMLGTEYARWQLGKPGLLGVP